MKQTFGQWLQLKRAELNLTKYRLAKDLNCSNTYIRTMEIDKYTPSKDFAIRIADYFEDDRDYVLSLIGMVSDDVLQIILDNPVSVCHFIRKLKKNTGNR